MLFVPVYVSLLSIIVAVSHGSFLVHPQSQYAELGSSTTLRCRFSNPSTFVLVSHNQTQIGPINSESFFYEYSNENATLLLRNISHMHAGDYQCIAIFNHTHHILSEVAVITIAVPPGISSNQITTTSANQFASGNQFRIPFEFTGTPEPTFVLLQLAENGRQLVVNGPANGNVFSWLGNELIITAPIPKLSGYYRLLASNQFGTQEFDFELEFTVPNNYGIYEIEGHPNKENFILQERVTLSCITKQSNVIGSWYKQSENGDLIVNIPGTSISLSNGNLSLEFHNLTQENSGVYVCRLKSGINGLTVDEATRRILVFEDLTDKVPLQVDLPLYTFGDTWISVNWTEPDTPDPVTTYHLNITVVRDDSTKVQTIEKDFGWDTFHYNQTELENLNLGLLHIIQVSASNIYGRGIASEPILLKFMTVTPQPLLNWAPIVGGGLGGLFLISCTTSILCFLVCSRCYAMRRRSNEFKKVEKLDSIDVTEKGNIKVKRYVDDPNTYIVTNLPPSYEVLREGVELQDVVEETSATISYRATIESIPGKLEHGAFAKVKLLKGNATALDLRALINEMEMMATIGCHSNITGFLGACTTEPLYVITEYLPFGDLLSYLRASRGHHVTNSIMSPSRVPYFNAAPTLTPADLLSFAVQISNGMKFLTSKHVIHSRLCSKNIMVGEDKQIKIGNYGQNRRATPTNTPMKNIEVTPDDVMLKWTAPECYFEKVYSNKSDVWSYGVLLWEIVTIGATPYPGVKTDELYTILSTGYRMEKPQQCPHELYLLMLDTWMAHPDQRPTFQEIHERITKIIRNSTLGEEKSPSSASLTNGAVINFRL